MKGLRSIIIIGALVVVGFAIVEDLLDIRRAGKSTSPTAQFQPVASAAGNNYALRAVDNTWPAIETAQSMVADNLSRKNYYLVMDGSGSMAESRCSSGKSKISVAKSAVIEFINKIPGDANLGLLVFDKRGTSERVPLGLNARDQAIAEIRRVQSGGGTPLDSVIRLAYRSLTRQAESQLGYGEYHLVVVTDGEASEGQNPSGIVKTVTADSPVVLHTIGFCISGSHSLNQAGITLYKSANNPMDLARGLDSVLAEASDFTVDSFEGQAQ